MLFILEQKKGTFYVNTNNYKDLNQHELLTLTLTMKQFPVIIYN